MTLHKCQCIAEFSRLFCDMQEERSRGEHTLTNIAKTQERVQADKGGKYYEVVNF